MQVKWSCQKIARSLLLYLEWQSGLLPSQCGAVINAWATPLLGEPMQAALIPYPRSIEESKCVGFQMTQSRYYLNDLTCMCIFLIGCTPLTWQLLFRSCCQSLWHIALKILMAEILILWVEVQFIVYLEWDKEKLVHVLLEYKLVVIEKLEWL